MEKYLRPTVCAQPNKPTRGNYTKFIKLFAEYVTPPGLNLSIKIIGLLRL